MITKAVVTSAGFGTRFLPISKTIQKEMLPVLNRPLIDYVVEDLIKAGVTEIIFVINEHNQQVLHYYSENPRLRQYLAAQHKDEAYEQVAHIHRKAKFTFVRQPKSEPYGTAVPVKLCEELLKNEEAFFVFMGDDFIYHRNGHSGATAMRELFAQTGVSGIATFIERPKSELHKYGIAQVEQRGDTTYLKKLVEKPEPGTAPSNLSNISKYLLTPAVFEIIRQQEVDPKTGELYITDSVEKLAQQDRVAIHIPQGEYLDGGSVEGWLKANLTVAWDNEDLKQELADFFKTHLS